VLFVVVLYASTNDDMISHIIKAALQVSVLFRIVSIIFTTRHQEKDVYRHVTADGDNVTVSQTQLIMGNYVIVPDCPRCASGTNTLLYRSGEHDNAWSRPQRQ